MIDRVTYTTGFNDIHLFGKTWDHIVLTCLVFAWLLINENQKRTILLPLIWLICSLIGFISNYAMYVDIEILLSFPLMVTVITFNALYYRSDNEKRYFNPHLIMNYISILGIGMSLLSIIISIFHILSPSSSLPSINFIYYMYLVASLFSPIMLIVAAFYFPILFLVNIGKRFFRKDLTNSNLVDSDYAISNLSNLQTILVLIGIILLVLSLVSIPHIPSLNTDNSIIGDDSADYASFIIPLDNSIRNDIVAYFSLAFNSDRGLSLILFHFLSKTLDPLNSITSIEIIPYLLAPIFVISMYYLTKEFTSNRSISIISAFLAGISFHTLGGIYGGLYSNWLSLVFVDFTMLFMIRSLNKRQITSTIIFSFLLVMVLFTHEPTWPILYLIIIISLVLYTILNPAEKKWSVLIFLGTVPSMIFEFIRLITNVNAGIVRDVSFAYSQGVGFHDIQYIWNMLVESMTSFLGGSFGDPLMYFLVIIALYYFKVRGIGNILLVVSVSMLAITILFADTTILTRVLYELPIEIFAAIGLYKIYLRSNPLVFSFIILLLLAISIRTVSNFHFSPMI